MAYVYEAGIRCGAVTDIEIFSLFILLYAYCLGEWPSDRDTNGGKE
jgi:hypothetical protein